MHASDAEEAEALLLRWGPDGMGKVATPYWAQPIKKMLRNQAAVRERLGTTKIHQLQAHMSDVGTIDADDRNPQVGPSNLRVVNGNSAFTNTTSSSSPSIPTAPALPRQIRHTGSKLAEYGPPKSHFGPVNEVSEKSESATISESSQDTIRRRNSIEIIDIPDEVSLPDVDDGHLALASPSQLSNPISVDSSRGWLNTPAGLRLLSGFGIPDATEGALGHNTYPSPIPEDFAVPQSAGRAVEVSAPRINIELSIATLDRAASAKIYFENIYFPILRRPPSREQRRIALEKDLSQLVHLTEVQKEEIRQRWRLNETEYLRERRRRVSPEAFTRLKVIGHGAFGIVSLVREKTTGNLYAMKQVSVGWVAENCDVRRTGLLFS